MRKIILGKEDSDTIPFTEVNEYGPIFAKKCGKLVGMIVKDNDGWIVRIGGTSGATGHHETLWKCIEHSLTYAYEFFIE